MIGAVVVVRRNRNIDDRKNETHYALRLVKEATGRFGISSM